MSICPRCGNTIPTHGICYTCERIERERQRFGRRRPARRRRRRRRSTTWQLHDTWICTICGKKVRADRMGAHRWHAHGLRPYASREEEQRAVESAQRNAATTKESGARKTKTRECPICGYLISPEMIGSHLRHHERSEYREMNEPRPGVGTKRPTPHPVKAINRLLRAVYGRPIRLSQILRQNGLSPRQIRRLRHDHLDAYLRATMQRWVAWWSSILPANSSAMLRRHYDNILEQSVENVEALKNITAYERMDALAAALVTLRTPSQREKLESIATEEARAILNRRG